MIMKEVEMTPALARELIAKNTNNRTPNEARIASLAVQMKMGLWQQNGETIIVADTGRLLDGQHRLGAVIVSDCTVPMILVEGVKEESFHTINTGRPRRATDILSIAGHRNVYQISAAASQLYRMIWAAFDDRPSSRRGIVPPPVVLEVAERWPTIATWASQISSQPAYGKIPGSTLIPALIYLSEIAKRPDLSLALYEGLNTGAYLDRDSPILLLRNKIFEMRTQGNARTDWVWFYMVTVLDALEEGKPLTKFGQAKPYMVMAPKHLKKHLASLPDRKTLIDLKPPAVMNKIRDQFDMLRLAGIADEKTFAATVDRRANVGDVQMTAEERADVLGINPPPTKNIGKPKAQARVPGEPQRVPDSLAKPPKAPKAETAASLQKKAERAREHGQAMGRAALK